MKKIIFAVLTGAAAVIAVGCVHTVSDTSAYAVSYGRDTVSGRYNRSWDQVYKASLTVMARDGVVVREYVPHEYTNTVRQLEGRVNDSRVYIKVEQIDPKISQVDVEARTKYGRVDIDLVHEIEKDIALELTTY
jgi:hypothetical protein